MTIIVVTNIAIRTDSRSGWSAYGNFQNVNKIITTFTKDGEKVYITAAGLTKHVEMACSAIENLSVSDLKLAKLDTRCSKQSETCVFLIQSQLYQWDLDGRFPPYKIVPRILTDDEEEILFVSGSGSQFFHAYYAMSKSVHAAITLTAMHHPTCGGDINTLLFTATKDL